MIPDPLGDLFGFEGEHAAILTRYYSIGLLVHTSKRMAISGGTVSSDGDGKKFTFSDTSSDIVNLDLSHCAVTHGLLGIGSGSHPRTSFVCDADVFVHVSRREYHQFL